MKKILKKKTKNKNPFLCQVIRANRCDAFWTGLLVCVLGSHVLITPTSWFYL